MHCHNTRNTKHIHTSRTKHEFAKKCLKYNLPHFIIETPGLVVEKIFTHSLRGSAYHLEQYKNINTDVQYQLAIHVSQINKTSKIYILYGWMHIVCTRVLHIANNAYI